MDETLVSVNDPLYVKKAARNKLKTLYNIYLYPQLPFKAFLTLAVDVLKPPAMITVDTKIDHCID